MPIVQVVFFRAAEGSGAPFQPPPRGVGSFKPCRISHQRDKKAARGSLGDHRSDFVADRQAAQDRNAVPCRADVEVGIERVLVGLILGDIFAIQPFQIGRAGQCRDRHGFISENR